MTTVHHEIRIDAPLDSVWRALADLTAVEKYNPTVASARYVSEQRGGVGAMRRCELKPKGWVEERVWDWEPPHTLGLEVAASQWPLVFMKWKTELQRQGSATVMRQEMSYKMKFGPLGALIDTLVMRRKLNSGIADIFSSLKRYVEAGRA